ncbi:MAG: hypothetical protein V2I33_04675 [Kangiellaceae bacterium]|jgi:gamma-glutamyl:cysteine ligase YbdK (ATP-grasp superfamily)|nr:hypothetical protein [Kangiellaceae bacterium]
MGLAIQQESFSEQDYSEFADCLADSLEQLRAIIRDASFGQGAKFIGAELENYIVDQAGAIKPINQALIDRANKDNFTVELNQFNLEINLDPLPLDANCFSQLQAQLDYYVGYLRRIARMDDAAIVPIGILPTLQKSHLSKQYMTDCTRYQMLSKQLYGLRGEEFQVDICGLEELQVMSDHVGLEGANTSFQYHLMVPHQRFADAFNITQLTTPFVVALSANSPILLGQQLWDETRIALFKQSIDSRVRGQAQWRQPSRVTFGHGWVREDAWELFAETVALYPALFPITDATSQSSGGRHDWPELAELSLHMGTTWPWNRPVYEPSNGGHVRIEMRAMSSGPSNKDMCANAAFATGLVYGMLDQAESLLATIPFRFAEYNFYRAAQNGLDAIVLWPDNSGHPVEQPIEQVINSLLPIAEQGLMSIGIAQEEINYYLSIIEQRMAKRITGARWQREALKYFEQYTNRAEACQKMLLSYMEQQQTNRPVHQWRRFT